MKRTITNLSYTILLRESLHPKQWNFHLYLYIYGLRKKYSESNARIRWEILLPIDQEDTKAEDKNTYVLVFKEYLKL